MWSSLSFLGYSFSWSKLSTQLTSQYGGVKSFIICCQAHSKTLYLFPVGNSVPGQDDQDISPYATFHLLGMREEAKRQAEAAQMQGQRSLKWLFISMIIVITGQGANFQTMPSTPGSGPLTNPNTPAHQRSQNMSQTMYNVSHTIFLMTGTTDILISAPSKHP